MVQNSSARVVCLYLPFHQEVFLNTQIPLLVYDAVLIEIWREEVLPNLIKTSSLPAPSSLMIYSVVSHVVFTMECTRSPRQSAVSFGFSCITRDALSRCWN